MFLVKTNQNTNRNTYVMLSQNTNRNTYVMLSQNTNRNTYVMVSRKNPSTDTKYPEVSALGQYLCMSAHKARRIIDQIRGRSYEETLMILELMPYRACYPILKLVYSAAANASQNRGFNKASLVISKAEVNEGSTIKKSKPRARGRSYLIKKPTCHIRIVLRDLSLDKELSDECKDDKIIYLKNPRWINKSTNMTSHDMYSSYSSGGLWDKK